MAGKLSKMQFNDMNNVATIETHLRHAQITVVKENKQEWV